MKRNLKPRKNKMRITDPKALACSRYPGSIHSTNDVDGTYYHIRLGNGCWAQYKQKYDAAREYAEEEAARCQKAVFGVEDHGSDYASLKGWVSWAFNPLDKTTAKQGGFAMFVAPTQELALYEARDYITGPKL